MKTQCNKHWLYYLYLQCFFAFGSIISVCSLILYLAMNLNLGYISAYPCFLQLFLCVCNICVFLYLGVFMNLQHLSVITAGFWFYSLYLQKHTVLVS